LKEDVEMAQVDFFLKLDGIKGESADSKHKGEIEIASFSWGAANQADIAGSSGGGGGAGKVSYQDVSLSTHVNEASPLLMLACATGEHIKSALLTVRKQGGEQQDYYKVTLTDVLISSYQSGGSSGANALIPMDQFSLNFAKIEFSYARQDEKGKLSAPKIGKYDLKANKKG
jgi:type VI secretion system secreted protein Hcp